MKQGVRKTKEKQSTERNSNKVQNENKIKNTIDINNTDDGGQAMGEELIHVQMSR